MMPNVGLDFLKADSLCYIVTVKDQNKHISTPSDFLQGKES